MGQIWSGDVFSLQGLTEMFGDDCQEVIPGLYIGHVGCVTSRETLERYGIRRLVNVSERDYALPAGVEACLQVALPDDPSSDLRQHFAEIGRFIQASLLEHKPVLVHCVWGRSRSGCAVVAYLIEHGAMSLDAALQLTRSKRSCVHPNPGFMEQLREHERDVANRQLPIAPSLAPVTETMA